MGNLLDYLAWRGDLSLEHVPFGAVDALVLSALAYVHFDGLAPSGPEPPVSLGQTAERYLALPAGRRGRCRCERDLELLRALTAAPRFAAMGLTCCADRFVPKEETQFAALTVLPGDGSAFLAFRGTDGTLVGWKEDFNLSFLDLVPAQLAAADYVQDFAQGFSGPLWLGGHSKGGNLAVYAAAHSAGEVQERIARVYSHDGPGFLGAVLRSGEFQAVTAKIDKTLPQSSLVGMLLEQQEKFRIVKSGRGGLWQHDPFSWVVEGNDFCFLEELTPDAQYLDKTLNRWLGSLTTAERERFVDSLYGLVDAAHIETLAQLRSRWQESVPAILRAASQLDPDTKEFLFQTGMALVSLGVKNFPEMLEG